MSSLCSLKTCSRSSLWRIYNYTHKLPVGDIIADYQILLMVGVWCCGLWDWVCVRDKLEEKNNKVLYMFSWIMRIIEQQRMKWCQKRYSHYRYCRARLWWPGWPLYRSLVNEGAWHEAKDKRLIPDCATESNVPSTFYTISWKIRDATLSGRLQLNCKLDLATAIAQVRQHMEVKQQQAVLRSVDSAANMDTVVYHESL